MISLIIPWPHCSLPLPTKKKVDDVGTIQHLLEFYDRFLQPPNFDSMDMTLLGAAEAHMVADDLAERGINVLLKLKNKKTNHKKNKTS